MNDAADVAVTRFDFTHGLLRGTHLTLFPSCLVHRGEDQVETIPLGAMTSVRVAFERDKRRLGWASGLLVAALVLALLSGPLGTFAAGAAAEMAEAGSQGVARSLHAFFGLLEAIASVLPVLAAACALGAAALGWLGWQGETTLRIALPGAERVFAARGRDSRMMEFAQTVSERLMSAPR